MSATITANVARLAAERGLAVEEVERRAGLKRGALSPVDGSKMRVTHLSAVCDVLGVEMADLGAPVRLQ